MVLLKGHANIHCGHSGLFDKWWGRVRKVGADDNMTTGDTAGVYGNADHVCFTVNVLNEQ